MNNIVQAINGKIGLFTPVFLVVLTLLSGNILWMLTDIRDDVSVTNIRIEKVVERTHQIELRMESISQRSEEIPLIREGIRSLDRRIGVLESNRLLTK
jgi:hypothetical protein